MKRFLAGAALGLITAFGVTRACERPLPPIKYTEFIIDTIIGEPDTVVQWRERVVFRTIEPEFVAEQPGGATDAVEQFCQPDTVRVPMPTPWLARSVVTNAGWFFGKDKVTVYGFDGLGTRRELQFRSYPGWQFALGADQLIQEPRFGRVKQIVEIGVPLVIGYIAGSIR